MNPIQPNRAAQYPASTAPVDQTQKHEKRVSFATIDEARSHAAQQNFPDRVQARRYLKYLIADKDQIEEKTRRIETDPESAERLKSALLEKIEQLPVLQITKEKDALAYLKQYYTSREAMMDMGNDLLCPEKEEDETDTQTLILLSRASQTWFDQLDTPDSVNHMPSWLSDNMRSALATALQQTGTDNQSALPQGEPVVLDYGYASPAAGPQPPATDRRPAQLNSSSASRSQMASEIFRQPGNEIGVLPHPDISNPMNQQHYLQGNRPSAADAIGQRFATLTLDPRTVSRAAQIMLQEPDWPDSMARMSASQTPPERYQRTGVITQDDLQPHERALMGQGGLPVEQGSPDSAESVPQDGQSSSRRD